MKLSKNIRYLVRVRDYETVHVEVGAEADHHDLGYSDQDWAIMLEGERIAHTNELELLVIEEVERLARHELEIIAQWSEISPNLAEDFLSTAPMPRSVINATDKKVGATTPSRRVRRDPRPTPPTPAA